MRAIVVAIVAGTIASSCAVDYWWKNALIYQIYPRSFKDSDGDGIGDLNGITSKLPYLRETGIDAIWLSPIYLSPMYDFGYDITDYRQIAPEYGTMEDFDALMREAKRLGIKVVLDYVPNHTSNESEWFVKSARREPGYEDYYIWADGVTDEEGNMQPPNNWVSIFRKSAWEYNAVRGQYYLHQFVIGQPDLNYRSAAVQQEMKDVLSFWLDKGVSGFRVDAINMMYEVNADDFGGRYPDEPLSGTSSTPDDYGYLDHIFTKDQPETYDVVYDWRDLLDTYTERDGESKVMMTEAYTSLPLMIRYYGNEERNGSMPFNFLYLEQLNNKSTAYDMKEVIDKWMTHMPYGKTANWVNGNHDQSRLASRHGEHRVDAMNMLALILPGLTITYQGEELGMTDGYISWEDTRDPQACNTDDPENYWRASRDPARTPFHWAASAHAGFSDTAGATWLPVAHNYATVNLAVQKEARKSHYKVNYDQIQACNTDDPENYWRASRDPARTPFHWAASAHAGFSDTAGATWLPVAHNYATVNLAAEKEARKSHYKFYKDVVSIKHSPTVRNGDYDTRALSENVFVVTRLLPGHPAVIAIMNLSDADETVDLSNLRLLPKTLYVTASGVDCQVEKGELKQKDKIPVSAHCALVLQSIRRCC